MTVQNEINHLTDRLEGARLITTGVVEALRALGDGVLNGQYDHINPIDLIPIMQQAEAAEKKLFEIHSDLKNVGPVLA